MRKLQVTFKQENPDFNKEYAKQYYEGKESQGNSKDNWSRGLNTIIVKNFILEKNIEYNFIGSNQDGIELNVILKNMTLLKCQGENGENYEFVVSRDLIKGIRRFDNDKYNLTKFYFYFKPRNDFKEIDIGMYLLNQDIPIEFLKDGA